MIKERKDDGRIYNFVIWTQRIQWMIEVSDCLVCYVDHESGGAYHALKYARKLGKTIVNLSHIIKNS